MARTVAEHLVDTLAAAGVRQIYGIVGDSLNPVTDALRRSGSIRWVDVRHEETAAFAAGAEAQLTGQLAVCAGSCGPGNLHLINGLYDAHRSVAPVLAIAAHIPSSEVGTGYFQETHPDQLFRECSHYCELVSNPRQAPRVLQSAMQHAVSKRGVSVVVLPGDVAALEAPADACAHGPVVARSPGTAGGRRPGPPGRPRERGQEGGALLRHRLRRCARRGRGPGREAPGARRLQLPRQGVGRVRQPQRRGHERAARLGRRLPGDARVRRPAAARHGLPLRERSCRRRRRSLRSTSGPSGWAGGRSSTWACAATSATRSRPCCRWWSRRAIGRSWTPCSNSTAPRGGSSAPTSITSASGGRSIPSTSPPRWTSWPAPTPCSPSTPACAPSGAPATSRRPAGRRFLGSFNHGSMANALPQAIGAQTAYPGRQVISLSGRRRPGHAAGRAADGRPVPVAGQDRPLQQPPPRHGAAGAGGRRPAPLRRAS